MKHLLWTVLLAAVMVLGVAAPAWSHHSHAMYDFSKQNTITGTVTEFLYRNPHVELTLDVQGENGKTVNYWIEMSNLRNMIHRGIGKTTFKPGDKVTVHFHPLTDGRPGGSYITIVAADGKTYE